MVEGQSGQEAGQEQKRKIQVDEEWKRAVAEEKERLRQEEAQKRNAAAGQEPQDFPEPSIEIFLAGLYTQTLIALGELPNPVTGGKAANIREAAYLIDTIALLRDKMQGNLTERENSYLSHLLHDLQLRYVAAAEAPPSQAQGGGEQGKA